MRIPSLLCCTFPVSLANWGHIQTKMDAFQPRFHTFIVFQTDQG